MLAATCLLLLSSLADEPAVIPLWPEGAPGSEARKSEAEVAKGYSVKNVHNPTLTVFLPPKGKATGAAVVICPGGGHRELVYKAEGVEPAQYLNSIGVAAFVLKYRLAREPNAPYKVDVHPLQDGQRAMRLVRSRAAEFGLDPKRIGIVGFSAGGEVASMVSYTPGAGDPKAADPIDRQSSRPDFQVMIYPGPLGIPEKLPADAPPEFLLVSNDDGAARVIVDLLRKAREAKVPVEAHILAKGGHGFNMGNRSKLESVKTWPQRLADWLGDNAILDPNKPGNAR